MKVWDCECDERPAETCSDGAEMNVTVTLWGEDELKKQDKSCFLTHVINQTRLYLEKHLADLVAFQQFRGYSIAQTLSEQSIYPVLAAYLEQDYSGVPLPAALQEAFPVQHDVDFPSPGDGKDKIWNTSSYTCTPS